MTTLIDYGHWDISRVPGFVPEDHYGFLYMVINRTSGKKYIGKKTMWLNVKKTIRRVDGKGTKVVRSTKESNWRTYTSSSKWINEEIEQGVLFDFIILSLHPTKGALTYAEVEQLVKQEALLERFPNGDRVWYNGMIPAIKFIPSST
jgi:hypothetical protein